MRKKLNYIKLGFLLVSMIMIGSIIGCNKEPALMPAGNMSNPVIGDFWLEKTVSNPNLNRPYQGMIMGDTAIHLMVDYGTNITSIEPTVFTNADSLVPKGKQNFSQPITYTVWAHGKSASYTVSITVDLVQSPVIQSIAAGFTHVVAIKNDGTLWVCGNNYSGQLGLGDFSSRNMLTQVPIYNVDQVFTGDAATFVKLKDGTMWGTGNQYGQLGLGNKNGIASFTRTPFLDDAKEIAITFGEVFVLKPDGTIWGAGRNFGSILCQGDYDPRASFVKIPIDNVKHLGGCGTDIIVQKNNDQLWGWGLNISGNLGVGDNSQRKMPTQLNTPATGVSKMFVGAGSVFLIDKSGHVWATGANTNGELALSDISNRNVFTQVTFFNNKPVDVILPRLYSTGFIDNTGAVWNVGNNSVGMMGLGNVSSLPYTTPVQLPGFAVKSLAGLGSTGYALKNDGTLWSWGANSSGALGIGSYDMGVSSPNQIK